MTSPFKVVLISTSVLSAVIMLNFSAPAITDLAEYVPLIYNGVVSWMTPPYLYLVINCIIITIVASSKLQSMKDGNASLSPAATQPLDVMGIVDPQRMTAPLGVRSIETDYRTAEDKYSGVALSDSSDYEVKVERGLELDSYRQGGGKNEESEVIATGAGGAAASLEDAMSNKENEFVTAKTTWSVPENKYVTTTSPSSVKPPVSARFGHRRNSKASPEGVKTGLGVSKPKRLDTLESTWRTITEGRAIPITRHLKKSDTWERDSHLRGRRGHEDNKTPERTMAKAETFNDRTNTRSPSPGSSGGSVKLRREASPSQDELNRRVEAFIKKFNEDMRLQRQESFNQYKEMVNRGSH